ncbi:MAG TPA: histidine kinase [Candidatus Acidoferrum sp.]|jgi:two-component sensor histidine kinase
MSEQDTANWKRWAGTILLVAVFSTLIGFIFALPNLGMGGQRKMVVLSALALWWAWGILAFLIVAVDARLPFSAAQLGRRIAAHVVLSVLFTSLFVYVLIVVRALLGLQHWATLWDARVFPNALRGMFLWNLLIYWVIAGGWQAYRYNQSYVSSELRSERLERQFSEARLNVLRMQLNPHFLFNALNTISSQVERDPRLARAMIEHLGDLLRLSLESKDKQEVPLAEEMEFLEHYVAIQKIRFGDNLKIEVAVTAEARTASVPSLFLQPLVENAIRHGVSRRASGGTVEISAVRVDGRVKIRVVDDGVGLPAGWDLQKSAGLGLTATRERIAGIYADGQGRLSIRNRDGGGTEVEVELPFRLVGGERA